MTFAAFLVYHVVEVIAANLIVLAKLPTPKHVAQRITVIASHDQ